MDNKIWKEKDNKNHRNNEEVQILKQGSLFSDLPINEEIVIEKLGSAKVESKRAQKIIWPTDSTATTMIKAPIKIIHRKNFGVIEKNMYTRLDKNDRDINKFCTYKCRKGTLWVYYGFKFTTMYMDGNQLKYIDGLPYTLYDVLNEVEIYQLFAAIYKGKWNRDFDPNPPAYESGNRETRAAFLLSHERIEVDSFENLLANIIDHGENYLRHHWYYDKIMENRKSNPYRADFTDLQERLKLIPEEDKMLVRKILKLKKPYFSTKSNNYLPGIPIYEISQAYKKKEDGTHIRKADLDLENQKKIGFFVDPWKCADEIYDHMKEKEKQWKKWRDDIEIE